MRTRGGYLRDERKREGDARNAAWRALTVTEQIQSLEARRGSSTRQLTRLRSARYGAKAAIGISNYGKEL